MRRNILAPFLFILLHELGHVVGFLLFNLPIRRLGVEIFSNDFIFHIYVATSPAFYYLSFFDQFLTLIGIPLLFQLVGMKVFKINWRFIFLILFWFRVDLIMLFG